MGGLSLENSCFEGAVLENLRFELGHLKNVNFCNAELVFSEPGTPGLMDTSGSGCCFVGNGRIVTVGWRRVYVFAVSSGLRREEFLLPEDIPHVSALAVD